MFLVLGLARSGLATAAFLKDRGEKFVVFDDDRERRVLASSMGYEVVEEVHWKHITSVTISPGIPLSYPKPHPLVVKAKERGCEIVTDCTLLRCHLPHKKFIGITGTNGKSTTTALITHILHKAGYDAIMGGNIGVPALDLGCDHEIYVLELSSFQLERSPSFHLDIAVWLNMSEDHLAQHGTMEAYLLAKKRIFHHAKQKIICTDDKVSQEIAKEYHDAFQVSSSSLNLPEHPFLQGSHNVQNRIAAYYALRGFGLAHDTILQGMQTFTGLKHRQQWVGEIGPIIFINDSKATSAKATEHALKTFEDVYWLVGGQDKSDGIEPLAPYFSKVIKAFVYGAAKERFSQTLSTHDVCHMAFNTLDEALNAAYKDAKQTKTPLTVLLSPACASFDQYKDFEERGDHFIQHVQILTGEGG